MALNPRRRTTPIDTLQTDYEYATIKCYVEGQRNDLGEPARTLTQRATNVKCSIDPLLQTPGYIARSGVRELLRQGIIEATVYLMILSADQTIEPGDVVTDYNGTDYDVLHVIMWFTHKEAFLRKMN
jgi:hypothetical protein